MTSPALRQRVYPMPRYSHPRRYLGAVDRPSADSMVDLAKRKLIELRRGQPSFAARPAVFAVPSLIEGEECSLIYANVTPVEADALEQLIADAW